MNVEVRVCCPECDTEQEVDGTQVLLISWGLWNTYSFTCPGCLSWVSKRCDTKQARLLKNGGITTKVIPPPRPPLVEGREPTGPPLNEDDLIALGLELQRLP